jgi:hypothetical protein
MAGSDTQGGASPRPGLVKVALSGLERGITTFIPQRFHKVASKASDLCGLDGLVSFSKQ